MDENVPIREPGLTIMSVGDADDRRRAVEWICGDGLMPGVEPPCEEDAGLRQELLPEAEPLTMQECVQAGARLAK